jgi:hypothetical protein
VTLAPPAAPAPGTAPASLARLQRFARLLDSRFRIPVIGVRFGLDPILGLVPGLGDAAAFAFGAWIIVEGARMGAPRALLGRMLANSAVDFVTGSVPVAGSLVDFVLRANTRNVRLLETWLDAPHETERRSSRLFLWLGLGVGALVLAAVAAGVILLVAVVRLVAGG